LKQNLVESECLTETEEKLLRLVYEKESLPVEEAENLVDNARDLIAQGYLRLKVIFYPWGLNFELKLAERGAAIFANPSLRSLNEGEKVNQVVVVGE